MRSKIEHEMFTFTKSILIAPQLDETRAVPTTPCEQLTSGSVLKYNTMCSKLEHQVFKCTNLTLVAQQSALNTG